MSTLLGFVVLPGSLLAGCVPGTGRSGGDPTGEVPLTLTALDVDHPTFLFRCLPTGSRSC